MLLSRMLAVGGLLLSPCLAKTAPNTKAGSTTAASQSSSTTLTATGTTSTAPADTSSPPDVLLSVPQLSVGKIELDVENLQADLNLNARIANLVQVNAGVSISVQKINLTISDVDVELDLIIRLGHLVDIVNRVFQSVDLNPLIIGVANATSALVGGVVAEVDSLLGTITQGGTTLSFIVDNLGNIVQQVGGSAGSTVDSIVGNYLTNMTYTGKSTDLGNGLTQKVYSYSPLNALVDIVLNTAGQVVQATVAKASNATSSATRR